MRYFFEIRYKGTHFHGWQRQPNALSIQEEVEDKLSTLFGEEIKITASGRTDTGVHCEQQYFHTDLARELKKDDLWKINSFLSQDVIIRNIIPVHPEAHARFDAVYRRYNYFIITQRDPFLMDTAMVFARPIDLSAMNEAASLMVGEERDFKCFSKVKTDVKTFKCELIHAKWEQRNEMLIFDIGGNRFLRGMVRAIVGTLLEVGEGKRTISDFKELLDGGDRRKAGAAVPPQGLILKEVKYPENYFK